MDVLKNEDCVFMGRHSAEILICVSGAARLTCVALENGSIDIKKGESVLIPADTGAYKISGNARFYKAGVPL
jgi:mannose-6-phosphate isomerase class I